jgi:hypothetical protein
LVDPGIKRIDLLQFLSIDFDQYAPAVLGIGLTLERAYTKPELEEMLAKAGFKEAEVRTNDIGTEAWFEK